MALRLRAAAALIRPAPQQYQPDEEVLQFYRDLLGPRGSELDEELARRGTNITFTELAERALRAAPGALPRNPDLLVLAYALHDLHPLTTVSSRLNHQLGGRSRSFAVSEQGLGAPFTALRIAQAYARSGRCRSAALFVLEQATYPYPVPFSTENSLIDSGVYLLFGEEGDGWEPRVLHTVREPGGHGREPGGLRRVLRSMPPEALVVTGPWTDPAVLDGTELNCYRVRPGSYATSVWAALARHHEQWAGQYEHLVLCDTDVRRGVSWVAAFTGSGASTESGAFRGSAELTDGEAALAVTR
jgi:hypothetical protein